MRGIVKKSTGALYQVWQLKGSQAGSDQANSGEISGQDTSDYANVDCSQIINCKIKGNFRTRGIKTTNPIAVGDIVVFEFEQNNETAWIKSLEERKNVLIRRSVNLSKRSHIIASNVDIAFCVVSLANPRTPIGFIDRFLVAASAYHLKTSLVFNKIDSYSEEEKQRLEELIETYQNLGIECFRTSAKTGEGIEDLKNFMSGKICLFSGNSGVGKSAIINHIDLSLNLKIGDISNYNEKGKHTTTFAEMHKIECKNATPAFLIDSPGIKELGLLGIKKDELSLYFPDFKEASKGCRFSNCSHSHEKDCAVVKAVEEGKISLERYRSYIFMLESEDVETASLITNKNENKK